MAVAERVIRVKKRRVQRGIARLIDKAPFELMANLINRKAKKESSEVLPSGIIRIKEPRDAHRNVQRDMLVLILPRDGAVVPERPLVEGTVSDPNADVWVIIHPMDVSDYWVQPRISVRGDGTWTVQVYVGRPGRLDVGKRFEIMACANPSQPVSEGTIVTWWPDAKWKSEVIRVLRG